MFMYVGRSRRLIHLHIYRTMATDTSKINTESTSSLASLVANSVELSTISLRRITKGVAAPETEKISASDLWKDGPVLIFAARRPGCAFCREQGQSLSTRFLSGEYSGANVVAILKEVAPSGSVKTDEELGVQVFQETYFNNFPVYLDEKRDFYKFLGSRNVMSQKWSTYNPFKLYSGLKSITNRLSQKKVEGNYVGDAWTQGGIILVHPEKGVVYTYYEDTGSDIPVDEIGEALRSIRSEKSVDPSAKAS